MCGKEMVGLQYILRMIKKKESLPEIRFCYDQETLDNAVSEVLDKMMEDVVNDIEKDKYELDGLKTVFVDVDIDSNNVKQIDEEGYKFEIVR